MLDNASSKLPDQINQLVVSLGSELAVCGLNMSKEAEESPLLEAATKQRLLKTEQSCNSVYYSDLWSDAILYGKGEDLYDIESWNIRPTNISQNQTLIYAMI